MTSKNIPRLSIFGFEIGRVLPPIRCLTDAKSSFQFPSLERVVGG